MKKFLEWVTPKVVPLAYYDGTNFIVEPFLFIFGRALKIGHQKGIIQPWTKSE